MTHTHANIHVHTQAFGHVRDVVTGEAIEGAALRTTAFEWNYDEAVATNAFGRYHLWVADGDVAGECYGAGLRGHRH